MTLRQRTKWHLMTPGPSKDIQCHVQTAPLNCILGIIMAEWPLRGRDVAGDLLFYSIVHENLCVSKTTNQFQPFNRKIVLFIAYWLMAYIARYCAKCVMEVFFL